MVCGAPPVLERALRMACPKAAASAGAGGWTRRCPWSWGRAGTEAAGGSGFDAAGFGCAGSQAFRMSLIQLVRDHWVHILVPMGFVIGCYLDRKSDEKLTAFRNKSLLFKRELRPNEEVTWK
ncbi:NADH dehydrogenase [ubiquinone] 1 beta subcomplex subunit 1 isoform X1 [Myotis lucifugus]|uniref:NADH dehydrogenase [ubiquinone] 1 beta subcomplex subunit 1 isoform X1 n=1 Tax=Myotis lucifugus TaxID=59463 RepID=UPI000CCC7F14|nr:NADH dehydrogenase [ubiquinone] 1 beta subcomplex subunit 1 isoform X1 [Myotis lucifugus]